MSLVASMSHCMSHCTYSTSEKKKREVVTEKKIKGRFCMELMAWEGAGKIGDVLLEFDESTELRRLKPFRHERS